MHSDRITKTEYNFKWKTCFGSTLQLRCGEKVLGYLVGDTVPGQRVSKNRAKWVWTWSQTCPACEGEYPAGICALPESLPVFEKHRVGNMEAVAAWERYLDSLPTKEYNALMWE